MRSICSVFLVAAAVITCSASAHAQYVEELANMSRVDQLPRFAGNANSKQLSSYDTTGGNDDGFSGKYSFIRQENGKQVIGHLKGPGIIQRIWTPTPTADSIEFFFDGESTARIALPFIDLFSGKQYPFVRPVVGNEVGGYYCYIPIPYKKSCKILFKGKMQFFQIQYIETDEARVKQSFSTNFNAAEKQALQTAVTAWSNFTSEVAMGKNKSSNAVKRLTKRVLLRPGETQLIADLKTGGRIVSIRMQPKATLNTAVKDVFIKASWDGESVPAIYCPLTDFFGYAFGKPSMKSVLVGVYNGTHYSRIPMPFSKSAKIELQYLQHNGENVGEIPIDIEIDYTDSPRKADEGKFYTVWNREKDPAKGKPFQILKFSGRGHYIGTSLQSQGRDPGMTLFFEGDDQAHIDGKLAIHGTGSEDYFNGGWYALADRWDQAYSLPTHGCLAYSVALARTGGYRFYVTDKLSFKKDFLLTIEHGPENNAVSVDYISVAYFYADKPPVANAMPAQDLLSPLQPPASNVYVLDLLPVQAMSASTSVSRVFVKDDKSGNEYNVYKIEGDPNGFAKFKLEVPGNGKYKLYASYLKTPGSGKFDVNQRQIPVQQQVDAHATANQFVEKAYLGELSIEEGTNTITIVLKDKAEGAAKNSVLLQGLFLEKLN